MPEITRLYDVTYNNSLDYMMRHTRTHQTLSLYITYENSLYCMMSQRRRYKTI